MQRIIILTEDGSSSVYVPELEESYHSKYGSLQESGHVFIRSGLAAVVQNRSAVSILEVGFGTGLNAFLTYLYAIENNITIDYHAIEAFPLEKELYTNMNYAAILNANDHRDFFIQLHESGWNKNNLLKPGFSLHKYHTSLQDLNLHKQFDLIFFDAFAPRVQPELWTTTVFSKMYEALNPGGILVTYCAKGDVKRNMKAAGFKVEALPGPKGKREMTRALKCDQIPVLLQRDI